MAEPLSALAGQRAEAWLDGLYDVERTGRAGAPTLERIAALVAALDHPETAYRVVHVTGTNGKGSTTAMTAALVGSSGVRVGAYTSPHLSHPVERVAVDGRPITTEELWTAIGAVASAAGRAGVQPTWFEAVTAAGLWWFREAGVEVAVVEVGMLGRWDATNVVHGEVAVVTNVELDHTDVAGPTRAHVAAEKAGIVEPGATLVLGETDPALRSCFEAERPGRVLLLGSELGWSGRRPLGLDGQMVDVRTPWAEHPGLLIGALGAHQCDNAVLAIAAVEALLEAPLAPDALRALSAPVIAGRLEVVARRPTVLVDGAHNPAGAAALREALQELDLLGALGRPRCLVLGVLGGRDTEGYLRALDPGWLDSVVVTEPPSPRALPAEVLAKLAATLWPGLPVAVEPDPATALARARGRVGGDGLVVVAGSLYLPGRLGDQEPADRADPADPADRADPTGAGPNEGSTDEH
ncbi:MAG: Mur ligase family protein [Actinomycetota bacterium]|nr:Mur ligase family protein [Actinomycetota bacterium]